MFRSPRATPQAMHAKLAVARKAAYAAGARDFPWTA